MNRIIKAIIAGFLTATLFLIILPMFFAKLGIILGLPSFNTMIAKFTGAILFTMGLSIAALCTFVFIRKGDGTPAPIEPPKKLVCDTIYSLGRNPMYIGYFLMIIGETLFTGHSGLIIYAFLLIPGIHYYVVFFEEPKLQRRFGKCYLHYKLKTPRWIGKLY